MSLSSLLAQGRARADQDRAPLAVRLLAGGRLALAGGLLALGLVALVLVRVIPRRFGGGLAAPRLLVLLARALHAVFDVEIDCRGAEGLRRHRGVIVANHLSFLDVTAILSVTPVRFLAAEQIRRRPLLGAIARLTGSVFVAPEDAESRVRAWGAAVKALWEEPELPLVIFPEGELGRGRGLLPFHPGAFHICARHRFQLLPCAIRTEPSGPFTWGGEGDSFRPALRPLARSRTPVRLEVRPLGARLPVPGADARSLASAVRREIRQALVEAVEEVSP